MSCLIGTVGDGASDRMGEAESCAEAGGDEGDDTATEPFGDAEPAESCGDAADEGMSTAPGRAVGEVFSW